MKALEWRGVGVLMLMAVSVAHAQPVPEHSSVDPKTSGAASTKIPVSMQGGTEVLEAEGSGTSTPPPVVSLEEPINPDTYICGAGDVFELNFWGQQNFRLRIAVDLEGRTFISKVGFVTVAGKTLTAVRTQIKQKVKANYPGLQFDLTLVNPRSFVVHVVENVKQPGSYTSHPVERVSTLLARAGGVTGSRRQIKIKRKNGTTVNADLTMYELTGNTALNPLLLDGDVVSVPVAELVVEVAGAVNRPGKYELVASKDLLELLQLAGGLTSSVARSLPIRVVRRDSDQRDGYVDLTFAGKDVPNTQLRDDDRIIVSSTDELQRTVQLIGAVVGADSLDMATTTKRLRFIEGDTVRSLIERSGGIRAPGDLSRSYISRPRANAAPELIAVDLDALFVRRDFSKDVRVQMGDSLVVPAMQYSVRVEGAVTRTGLYPFNPRFGIAEYIASAGGRTRTARDLDEVKLVDPNGRTHTFDSKLKPAPGDAIVVPERNFTRAEVVQIVIAGAGLILSGVAITLAATR